MTRIAYDVSLVMQGNAPTCWMACAAMVMGYKDRQSVPQTAARVQGGFDPQVMSAPWDEVERSLTLLGFVNTSSSAADEGWILGILQARGPIILLHYCQGFPYHFGRVVTLPVGSTHAVVLTGVDTERHKTCFSNPWGTRNTWVDSDTIAAAIRRVSGERHNPISYLP